MVIDDCHATFTLKLSGIDLANIHPRDVGALLAEFCRLLGDDGLKFGEIRQGSAIVTAYAPADCYEQILGNFAQNIRKSGDKSLKKIIRGYAARFENIQAQFLASPSGGAQSRVICDIDYREQVECVVQTDRVVGKLQKPAHGKDDTDHFTIVLHNGWAISVKVNKNLSQSLAEHLKTLWLGESLVAFTGTAKYEMVGFDSRLCSFTADGFEIVPNDDHIERWVDRFVDFGASGWQGLDNPLETWLGERH